MRSRNSARSDRRHPDQKRATEFRSQIWCGATPIRKATLFKWRSKYAGATSLEPIWSLCQGARLLPAENAAILSRSNYRAAEAPLSRRKLAIASSVSSSL